MAENYRQLGDTSVFVNGECNAQVAPLQDASSQIPLIMLSCEGPCFLGGETKLRPALFGVPLNAPEGNVSDPLIQERIARSCPKALAAGEEVAVNEGVGST